MGGKTTKNMLMGLGPLIDLAAQAAGGAPPEFRVWPAGWVEFLDGVRVLLDPEAMAQVVANWEATGYDLVIDYHHQSHPEVNPDNAFLRPDRKAPAAGWCRLEAREDGLWAVKVRWTPEAAEAVAEREFRYISPSFYWNRETSRVVVIEALSLTNRPATHAAEPLVAQAKSTFGGDSMEELKKFLVKLAALFGVKELTEDQALKLAEASLKGEKGLAQGLIKTAQAAGLGEAATPEEVAAQVAELAKRPQPGAMPAEGDGQLAAKVAQALGLKEGATEAEILGAAKAKADGAEGAGRLAERLAALEAERAEDKAEGLVKRAREEGKILPAQAEWLKNLAKTDPAQALAYLANAPRVVPVGDRKAAGPGPKAPEGLSPEAVKIAQLMGNDPAKVAELAKRAGEED